MWLYLLVVVLLLALLYALMVRQLVLAAVERARTREPRTLAELRFIAHILYGDVDALVLNQSKDRSAAAGRKARAQQKVARAKMAEDHRRKEALDTIKRRMGRRLAQRRAQREKEAGKSKWFPLW